MNVAQKSRRITHLPEYFAVHKIGGTQTDMLPVVQVNNVSITIAYRFTLQVSVSTGRLVTNTP